MDRRKFIQAGSLLVAAGMIEPVKGAMLPTYMFEERIEGPLIISTWIHGL